MIERAAILWHYARARHRFGKWRDRDALEAWQERQVRRHLDRVAARSSYFGKVVAEHGTAHWRQWPVMDKAAMMTHFDDWNTAGISQDEAWAMAAEAERTRDFSRQLDGVTVGLSSGTSGSRGIFLASENERRLWAGTLLARVLRGTLFCGHRAALFLRADSPLYRSIGSRRFQFSYFDLERPMEEHWPRLMELRPTILAAPPSVLTRLAARAECAQLLAPPAILLSVADVLDAADRARIEDGFGCEVGQIYQATEGFLAATCPHGRLHWNEDALVVQKEWLDPAHTRYTPILTDFRRSTQPIVRYRLDDVIVEDKAPPCPCGSIFSSFAAIEGRCDDVLLLANAEGSGEITVFPDFIRRAVVLAIPAGRDYCVAQISPSRWSISLSQPSPLGAIQREVAQLCDRLGAQAPSLESAAWAPPALHAKLRRVRRQIP